MASVEAKEHLRMSIGQEVKIARLQAGLDQGQLGDAVGVARNTVSRWENDHNEPSISQWRKIAQATGAWWMLRQPDGELPEPDESPFRTGRLYGWLQNCSMPAGQMELPFPLATTLVAVTGSTGREVRWG